MLAFFASCTGKKKETVSTGTNADSVTPAKATETTEEQSPIVGKWVVVDAVFENMTEAEKKKVIDTATLEFFRGDRAITVGPGTRDTVTYLFNKSNNQLKLTSAGDTNEFTITWVDGKMKMSNAEGWALLEKTTK